MKDTCNFEQCEFGKSFFNDRSECFNYIESWWTPSDGSVPILIGDCAPRRTMLMVQEHYNRLEGLQRATDEMKSEDRHLKNAIKSILTLLPDNKLLEIEG
jgi:hypothetical protein